MHPSFSPGPFTLPLFPFLSFIFCFLLSSYSPKYGCHPTQVSCDQPVAQTVDCSTQTTAQILERLALTHWVDDWVLKHLFQTKTKPTRVAKLPWTSVRRIVLSWDTCQTLMSFLKELELAEAAYNSFKTSAGVNFGWCSFCTCTIGLNLSFGRMWGYRWARAWEWITCLTLYVISEVDTFPMRALTSRPAPRGRGRSGPVWTDLGWAWHCLNSGPGNCVDLIKNQPETFCGETYEYPADRCPLENEARDKKWHRYWNKKRGIR